MAVLISIGGVVRICFRCSTYVFSGDIHDGDKCADIVRRRLRKKITSRCRERILRRDGERCVICGSQMELEIDHIVPVSRGGKHCDDNFQVLCRTCNHRKAASI